MLEERGGQIKKRSWQYRAIKWAEKETNPTAPATGISPATAARLHIRWAKFAPATQNAYGNALNRLNQWLHERLGLPRPEKFPVPRPGPQRITRPTEAEIQRILARAEPAMRAVLLLCADCGLRTGEARKVSRADLDEENQQIIFRQKGGTARSVPVTDRVAQMLRDAPSTGDESTPVCQLYYGEKRKFTDWVMHARWRALQKVLGLNPNLRMHDFRRRLATKVYERTKDLRAAQQILGHQSMASTLRYIAPFDPHRLKPLLEEMKVSLLRKEQR